MKLIPLKLTPGKNMSSNLCISKNILQIRERKVSKSKFMHTHFDLESISAIEQKAIVSCSVKMLHFYWDTQYRKKLSCCFIMPLMIDYPWKMHGQFG